MIGFLRKIRRSLVNSGAIQKYLLYAIGEIALVVIGIMIALQVNNWNNSRIINDELHQSYQKLIVDLNDDFARFQNLDSIISIQIKNAQEISQLLVKQNTTSDFHRLRSFKRLNNIPFEFSGRTYQAMINSGLFSRVEMDDLNTSISDYFMELESTRQMFSSMGNANRNIRDQSELYTFQYILRTPESSFLLPNKSLEWMNDPNSKTFQAVQYYMSFHTRQHSGKQNRLSSIIEFNQELLEKLEAFDSQ